jgi:hypothetical protein
LNFGINVKPFDLPDNEVPTRFFICIHPLLIVFLLNSHLSCGHPLPFPRARNPAPAVGGAGQIVAVHCEGELIVCETRGCTDGLIVGGAATGLFSSPPPLHQLLRNVPARKLADPLFHFMP